jgi:hypothetical protein
MSAPEARDANLMAIFAGLEVLAFKTSHRALA